MKKLLYTILYWSGFNYLYSLFLNKKLFIIMYHSITPKDGPSQYHYLYSHIATPAEKFEKELQYLKERGHTFISFDDVKNLSQKKIKKPTIVYFDDGFKDFKTVALPILNTLNIRPTVFPVTGILDRTDMIWTVLYREALRKEGKSMSDQNKMIEEIKNGTEKQRKEIMSQYSLHNFTYLFDIYMNWSDIEELAHAGVCIGSHGVTHTRLDEVSLEEVATEAKHSKFVLEKHIGMPVHVFSLPHGRGNEKVVQELEKAGYSYVVSKGIGLNTPPFTLNGVQFFKNVSPKPYDSLQKFSLKLYVLNIFK